jgi:hypothetical protein
MDSPDSQKCITGKGPAPVMVELRELACQRRAVWLGWEWVVRESVVDQEVREETLAMDREYFEELCRAM